MKKNRQSFSFRLAIRFMFLLTVAIIILSFAFLFMVRSIVNMNQTEELKNAEQRVFLAMCFQKSAGYLAVSEIPYYITYIAYDCLLAELQKARLDGHSNISFHFSTHSLVSI